MDSISEYTLFIPKDIELCAHVGQPSYGKLCHEYISLLIYITYILAAKVDKMLEGIYKFLEMHWIYLIHKIRGFGCPGWRYNVKGLLCLEV